MSGIITIQVNEGTYQCRECLEEALDELNLSDVQIVSKADAFSLSKSIKTQEYRGLTERANLKQSLNQVNEQVLPVYTLKHAIHSLKNKGFRYKRQRAISGGKRMFFEKTVGSGRSSKRLTYQIDVFPGEGRIVVEAGDMPGNSCRSYLKDFEKSMGKVSSFVEHQQTTRNRSRTRTRTNSRQRMRR